MLKKFLSLFLILLISCGGGGGGGGDTTEPVDPAPVAIFTGSPVSGPVPLQVNFTSGSSNATTHAWDFENDGSPDASGSSVSYTYNTPGVYSVSLTVTGSGGTDSNLKTDYITVTAVEPTSLYTADQSSGTNPLRVKFNNGSVNYSSSSWDFGDGNTSTETSPTHTYTATGSYVVSLTVTGEGGTNTNSYLTVDVSDIPTPAMILDSKYTTTSSGASIALDLKVLGVTGLAAAQATLRYDNSLITIGDITAGDFLQGNTDPLLVITSNPGIGRVIIYTSSLSSDQPSSDGDGVIATINLTVNGTIDTSIGFNEDGSGNIMLDVDGEDISINGLENGYLIVE